MPKPTLAQYIKCKYKENEPRAMWLILDEAGCVMEAIRAGLTSEKPYICRLLIELPEMIVTPWCYNFYFKTFCPDKPKRNRHSIYNKEP